jgi:hypothetical protein
MLAFFAEKYLGFSKMDKKNVQNRKGPRLFCMKVLQKAHPDHNGVVFIFSPFNSLA